MALNFEKKININDMNLGVFYTEGNTYLKYPSVIKGYLFHFTLKESFDIPVDFVFSLEFNKVDSIYGSLEQLSQKLEYFKAEVLLKATTLYEDVDQFGYINLFIVPEGNQYKLVVCSDSFDMSTVVDFYNIKLI